MIFRSIFCASGKPAGVVMALAISAASLAASGLAAQAATSSNSGLGMMSGTSPSITALSTGGTEIAFQANTGHLWMTGAAGTKDTELGMKSGTNPSIVAPPWSGYATALQANTGYLWTLAHGSFGLGMMSGTSPSLTYLSTGSGEAAFQANTGYLWTLGPDGAKNRGLVMAPGTSPSIAALPQGGYAVAFQGGNGDLWTLSPAGTKDTGLTMAGGTSPAIAVEDGSYDIAVQSGNGDLWTVTPDGGGDTGLAMKAGTSPSIASSGPGFTIAFQAPTGDLWTLGATGSVDTGLGMMSGTSPTVATSGNMYTVAFQANTGQLWTFQGSEQTTAVSTSSPAIPPGALQATTLALLQVAVKLVHVQPEQINLISMSGSNSFDNLISFVDAQMAAGGLTESEIEAFNNYAGWMEQTAGSISNNPAQWTTAQITSMATAAAQLFAGLLDAPAEQVAQIEQTSAAMLTFLQESAPIWDATWAQGQPMSPDQVTVIANDFNAALSAEGLDPSQAVLYDSTGVSWTFGGWISMLNGYGMLSGGSTAFLLNEFNPFMPTASGYLDPAAGLLYDGNTIPSKIPSCSSPMDYETGGDCWDLADLA